MDKRNLITVTLLLSALAFNPLVAREGESYTVSQQQRNSVSDEIASRLHQQGLEEEAAVKLAKALVDDDVHFAFMLENLLARCEMLERDEVLEYLSKAALFRQKVALHSYGQLVHMVTKIQRGAPDESVLQKLHTVAQLNQTIVV
jgi:hypothetical protein